MLCASSSPRVETRYDSDTAEFVLITYWTNGPQQIERFADDMSFRRRLQTLETQLEADRWTQRGPVLFHDGWKLA
jgi:hypothetical protein